MPSPLGEPAALRSLPPDGSVTAPIEASAADGGSARRRSGPTFPTRHRAGRRRRRPRQRRGLLVGYQACRWPLIVRACRKSRVSEWVKCNKLTPTVIVLSPWSETRGASTGQGIENRGIENQE